MIVLALALPAAADFKSADWSSARPILPGPVSPEGFSALVVDREVFSHSRPGLEDLRILAPDGREVPYVIVTRPEKIAATSYSPAIINRAVTPKKSQEVTLDFGAAGKKTNRLELQIPDLNFRRPVSIFGSDDARQWKLIQSGIFIFDFSGDVHVRKLILTYPENIFRYLKLEIGLEKEKPLTIEGVQLGFEEIQPALEDNYAHLAFSMVPSEQAKATDVRLNLGGDQVPVNTLRFEAKDPEFYRAVQLYDAKFKQMLAEGVIYRYPSTGAPNENLELTFPEQRLGQCRVRILNHDNQPLTLSGISGRGLSRTLVFRPGPSGPLKLYYGNPKANRPLYDLAALFPRLGENLPAVGSLGPVLANAEYQAPPPPPRDWSFLIWVALVPAALFLGWLVVRSLREINAREK